MRVYRISKRKYGNAAFSGIGSAMKAQRWNSKGIPLVYASESLALATLEILVSIDDYAMLSALKFVYFAIDIEPQFIEFVREEDLPPGWASYPYSHLTQAIGDRWFKEGRSAFLSVPSAIIRSERNILINPMHEDFKKIRIPEPMKLEIDSRLVGKKR
jgi:RES domain-containing protein